MDFSILIFFFLIIIPSAIIHEYSHGAVADMLGDPTARLAGRLTLNPIAHIDMFGTILLPLFLVISGIPVLFAYAKPVPYNPNNLSNKKWGPAVVGIAGPLSNIIVAVVFGILIRLLPGDTAFTLLLSIIVYANILLAVFNMIPIPPLDGSKVLLAVLPDSMQQVSFFLQRYGLILLLFFIFFGFSLIIPIINFLFTLIVGHSFF